MLVRVRQFRYGREARQEIQDDRTRAPCQTLLGSVFAEWISSVVGARYEWFMLSGLSSDK